MPVEVHHDHTGAVQLTTLGSALLAAALLLALFAVGAAVYGGRSGDRRWVESSRRAVYAMAGLLTAAVVLIEIAFVSDDFHFALVGEVWQAEDLEHADFLLNEANPKAAQALDLLLGVQGWRRFAEQNPVKFRQEQKDPERSCRSYLGVVHGNRKAERKDGAEPTYCYPRAIPSHPCDRNQSYGRSCQEGLERPSRLPEHARRRTERDPGNITGLGNKPKGTDELCLDLKK